MQQPEHYMEIALELSKRAIPVCFPNPPVGCVIVKDGGIVASGYTQAPGQFHAEAAALALYAGSLEHTVIFVTLEPCSFHGRTPSCARMLIERGAKTIYVATRDPDPRNNGKGLALLREAGITVHENVLATDVSKFLTPYLLTVDSDDMKAISIDNAEHYQWGDGCDGWHLLKSNDLSVIQESVPAGKAETLHFHRHAAQFFYILRGTAQLIVEGSAISLQAGQGLHVAANTSHQFSNASNETVEFLVISSPPSHGDRENM
jgi:pyrimidine deaminase RibD-like protein/quercetin dioxygenase-like cupin family protein